MTKARERTTLLATAERVPDYFYQSSAASRTESIASSCGWRVNLHGKQYGVAWNKVMNEHSDEVVEGKAFGFTVRMLPRSRLVDVLDAYLQNRKLRLPPQQRIDCTRAKL